MADIQGFINAVQEATDAYKTKINELTADFAAIIEPMIDSMMDAIANFGDSIQQASDAYKQALSDAYDQYIKPQPEPSASNS